jgi:polyketide synthase 13
MNNDYQDMVHESEIQPLFAGGAAKSMLAARVSYTFHLCGPSLVIDTACSSGLVAINAGVKSLTDHSGVDTAVCFGVNLLLGMKVWVSLQQAGMISDRSLPFSKDAKGYGRGEGCGVIILAAGSSCSSSKDPYASVVGSAVCSDGQSARPITRPASKPQMQCMRQAWGNLLSSCEVVEAHVTGTSAGDPAEGASIAGVFGGKHVFVGGAKGNVNHLEGAAGLVGVIKVLQMMRHKTIPPLRSWSPENSSFDFAKHDLPDPNQTCMQWQSLSQRRMAGVNGFGFGGQNAHVALAEATPVLAGTRPSELSHDSFPWKQIPSVIAPVVV